MRNYNISFLALRGLYIASAILVSYVVLFRNGYFNNLFLNGYFASSPITFITLESLIIYSLTLSIRPTQKSIGLGMIIAGLLLPTTLKIQEIVTHPVSLMFYVIFVIICLVLMALFGTLGNGILSQIISGIVYFFGLAILFQYSLLGIDEFTRIGEYLRYLYSYSLISNEFVLYSTVVGGIGFILLAGKKADFAVFNSIKDVSIKYTLASFIPSLLYLLYVFSSSTSLSSYLISYFPSYIGIILDVVAILVGIFLSNKRDLLASIIISSVSLGVSLFYTFSIPFRSFEFLISGASIIPVKLANPIEIENKLFNAIKDGKLNKANEYLKVLNRLGYSTSKIYCDAAIRRICEAIMWLPSKGRIEYFNCPYLRYAAECIISKGTLPPDVISLLKALSQRDLTTAERLAGLILTKSQDERAREQAKEVLARIMGVNQPEESNKSVVLPSLEDWNPEIWINSQLYGYKVTKVLGKGGTSYVLLGERGSEKYAIKIPRLTPSRDTKESFTTFVDVSRESSKLQEISEKSPHIVKLYGVFIDVNTIKAITLDKNTQLYYSNPPAIIMEYMSGGTAEDLLKNDAIFLSDSWRKIVALISLQIARAIKVIHSEGYVHLDIKPSNIFFSTTPGRFAGEVLNNLVNRQVIAKLGDLGSARKIGERFMEYTPQYCSIDQVKAMILGRGADTSMDIYAFGATIYKLLTRQPFNPPSLVSYMDKAVEMYLSKSGNYNLYLSSAENDYLKYYQGIKADDDFMKLIKSMTNPDPLKRPNIDVVITELSNIVNKL